MSDVGEPRRSGGRGINTRTEVWLSAHFVADIRERGVWEPITVRRRDDGVLVVRKGQRLTLAAVKVSLPRVRVLVEAALDPTEADRQGLIARIVYLLGENNHRAGIADHEEVAAHRELLELGLTAAQIARQTRAPTARIRQTARVASSEIAARAMARYELTFDQAAVVSEFDDGTAAGIEAVKALTVCAARELGRFAHAAQRARNDREDQQLLADAFAEAREQGLTLLRTAGDGEQDNDEHPAAQPLTELRSRVDDPSAPGSPPRTTRTARGTRSPWRCSGTGLAWNRRSRPSPTAWTPTCTGTPRSTSAASPPPTRPRRSRTRSWRRRRRPRG
ncbi:hypothetical protein LWC35_24245 [Pseudonocardia kujensis]|uniref:ParB/RepB/Spo0J family partition protein n=1 Tax=Pseudonocardia kujensis TaxID=1128675 RepID=UPI001E48ADE7|nr:hypothetical protein [Pseudonocardia kujensis]MCE0765990.1 hypothetical protein [Pseudonocardia kujensis]